MQNEDKARNKYVVYENKWNLIRLSNKAIRIGRVISNMNLASTINDNKRKS